MTKDELQPLLLQATQEHLALFAGGESATRFIFRATSGTTGMPLWRLDRLPEVSSRGTARRRFLVVTNAPTVQLSNLLAHCARGEGDVLALTAADAQSAELIRDFEPDCVIGMPSFLARLKGAPLRFVREVVLIGERCSSETERTLRALFPEADICGEYVNAELGKLGASCGHLRLNRYHPWKRVTIELQDGEILASRFLSPHVSVETYRTGDLGRLIDEACPCGEALTFEVLGRMGYDYVKTGGALLRVEEFERVASELELYIKDFRATVHPIETDEREQWLVRLLVEPKGELLRDAEILVRFKDEFQLRLFVAPDRTLRDAVASGLFLPLEVEITDEAFPERIKSMRLRLADFS